MAGRLTGLEYRWFGKGQLLATRYQHHEMTELDPGAAAVMAEVTEDATASPTSPESLRRVAARLALDADELDGDRMNAPSAGPTLAVVSRAGAERRIAALRCLATRFTTAASEIEAWK
jgi:hypothetical protein